MTNYRLYIDYDNKGYKNQKENTIPSIIKKSDNTEYERFLIIKEINNQDIPICFGEGREYKELEKEKVKVKR